MKTRISSADRRTREGDGVYSSTPTSSATARRRARANPGVRRFFRDAARQGLPLCLSAVTIGELRQGVEAVRHRGDLAQATRLAQWLGTVTLR